MSFKYLFRAKGQFLKIEISRNLQPPNSARDWANFRKEKCKNLKKTKLKSKLSNIDYKVFKNIFHGTWTHLSRCLWELKYRIRIKYFPGNLYLTEKIDTLACVLI